MAKLNFNKLNLKANQSVTEIHFNEQTIEVKQYLSVNDKLKLISDTINKSIDDNNFYNPLKIEVYFILEVIENYTNIVFTEKQKEDPVKLYDAFVSNGLDEKIFNAIPECEICDLRTSLDETIDSIYKYNNSVMGLLETISRDYSNLNLEASDIQKKIADPDNMTLLKDVLSKLG